MNLVDLIKGQIGGDVVNRLAGTLGTSTDNAQGAVNAAVPALLAGMTKLSDSSEGASRLASAVDNFDDRMIANPVQALAGGGNSSVVEQGSGLLSSLFGSNLTSGLSSALSRFTGLGSGAITKLLGFLTPMVLGGLRRQKTSFGLDAGGLSNMLAGQKQNIFNAMPSGLTSALGAIPGLNLTGLTDRAGEHISTTYDTGRDAVDQGATYAAAGASSATRWLLPVLGIALLLGLIWWLANRTSNEAPVVRNTPNVTTPSAPRIDAEPEATLASGNIPATPTLAGVNDQVTGLFKSTTDAFASITDAWTAEAALPKLRELNTKLDGITTSMNALPANEKSQAISQFESLLSTLKPNIEKAMAIPGVSDKIKPVVDQIMAKLNAVLGK